MGCPTEAVSMPDDQHVLDSFRLDGDVALITGAAGGIGGAVAEAVAEAGADVALVDVDSDGLAAVADEIDTSTDATTLAIEADVSDERENERMVAETLEELGGLDIAFANAGVASLAGTPSSYDMDEWDRIMNVNLRGLFLTNQVAAGAMIDGDGGRIINTASILGFQGTRVPGLAAYTAAKGGVVQVTRQLAAQLGRHDIRVNAMAPGWIRTAMTAQAIPDGPGGDAIVDQLTDGMALDRLGEPEDLKGTALYLASDASRYTTGEVVLVDGGMYAME